MSYEINFGSMLIIFILAFLIPLVINQIKFFRIPEVIGEIIAGIIIGKSGLDIIKNNSWIDFLSVFGFAYLMFLSGLEIDFSYLKRIKNMHRGENPFATVISIFSMTLLMSFVFANFLLYAGINIDPLILTLVFSATSLGIVVPALKETKVINKPIGQAILISAIIADFSTMLMLPVVMSIATGNKSVNFIYSLVILAAFFIMYFAGKKLFAIRFITSPAAGTSQWEIRAAFALILVFITISELVNIEIILGAFLAGILFSLFFQRRRSKVLPKLDAIGYGLLIPFFFIATGAGFDFKTVTTDREALILLPLLIIAGYVVKVVPSLMFRKYFNWKETMSAGVLLSSNLSMTIAIAFIAYKERLITESVYSTFLLFAIFTCITSPMIFYDIFL